MAQAADWPRLAEARGSLEHDLSLKEASGEPAAGLSLRHLVSHRAEHLEQAGAQRAAQVRADHAGHLGAVSLAGEQRAW